MRSRLILKSNHCDRSPKKLKIHVGRIINDKGWTEAAIIAKYGDPGVTAMRKLSTWA